MSIYSFYSYDASFRFALTESHEELTNIVKNKLWYIKKKEDLIQLLNVCFKEEMIPLKTIEMIVQAASFKALTLFKQLESPIWQCMINNQEDKFEYLLNQKFDFYQPNKLVMRALVEYNHLNLFKIGATKHLEIDKHTVKSIFESQFELCHPLDYAQVIIDNYSDKVIKKILNFTHEVQSFDSFSPRQENFDKRKAEFVVFMEKHLLSKEQNYVIIDDTSKPKNTQRLKL